MTIFDFLIILLVVLINLSFIWFCCVMAKKGDEECEEDSNSFIDSEFWNDSNR